MSPRVSWLHYSAREFVFDRSRPIVGRARRDKPSGFWISAGPDWRRWREGESWGIPERECVYEVRFAPAARLLTVDDPFSLHRQFPANHPEPYYENYPDWWAIAQQYDGVLIPDYHWSCRHDVDWYYSWDCASGCVWNLDAIESLTLLGHLSATDRLPEEAEVA